MFFHMSSSTVQYLLNSFLIFTRSSASHTFPQDFNVMHINVLVASFIKIGFFPLLIMFFHRPEGLRFPILAFLISIRASHKTNKGSRLKHGFKRSLLFGCSSTSITNSNGGCCHLLEVW